MTSNISGLLARFPRVRALVVGDAMLDVYLRGSSTRICREAPVPIVTVAQREACAGGAGNAAAAVAGLGASVALVSAIGDDAEGTELLAALGSAGVDTDSLLRLAGHRTLAKERVIADDHLLVRFDQGAGVFMRRAHRDRLVAAIERHWEWADVVIISDYGYGVVDQEMIDTLQRLRQRIERPVVVDAPDPRAFKDLRPTIVKPSFAQAAQMLGPLPGWVAGDRVERTRSWSDRLLAATGAQAVAVTLDVEGALLFEPGQEPFRTFARPVPNSHSVGAGDTYVATMAVAAAAGATLPEAAELASMATSIVVESIGTSVCTLAELQRRMVGQLKIISREALANVVADARRAGKTFVFTNGCFDILHPGHVRVITQARAACDRLILGLNSDTSVRRLKGPERPVQDERAQDSWARRLSPAAWEATGLTAECFSLVRMQADAQFAETLAMLADGASRAA